LTEEIKRSSMQVTNADKPTRDILKVRWLSWWKEGVSPKTVSPKETKEKTKN